MKEVTVNKGKRFEETVLLTEKDLRNEKKMAWLRRQYPEADWPKKEVNNGNTI